MTEIKAEGLDEERAALAYAEADKCLRRYGPLMEFACALLRDHEGECARWPAKSVRVIELRAAIDVADRLAGEVARLRAERDLLAERVARLEARLEARGTGTPAGGVPSEGTGDCRTCAAGKGDDCTVPRRTPAWDASSEWARAHLGPDRRTRLLGSPPCPVFRATQAGKDPV